MLAKTRRVIAATITGLALLAAVPSTALAEDDAGVWSTWAARVTDRESKGEVPFAVLFSLPAMIIVTPFWLAEVAIAKAKGEE